MKLKIKKATLDSLDKKIDQLGLRVFGIEKRFATKKDLERFATKDDLKKYATKDDIINFKDEILGEIRDMRDENVLITGRNSINRDMLEDHETRIGKLETAVSFPK